MRVARSAVLQAALWMLVWGCTGVISREVRNEAVPVASLGQLREEAQAYSGKTVILGGEIIEIRNRPDDTTLLVLEKSLGWREEPKTEDVSGGRFIVRFADYLDPVLFAPGRRVTAAGTVVGLENEPVGEAPYDYVVLEGTEIHLWARTGVQPDFPRRAHDPWYPWWYDPYWGRRPGWW